MNYAVEILRPALKQLAKIDRKDQKRILGAIRSLALDPRPPDCKPLTGRPAWRIRIGSYRVIYEIHDAEIQILVIAIGHRKNVYE